MSESIHTCRLGKMFLWILSTGHLCYSLKTQKKCQAKVSLVRHSSWFNGPAIKAEQIIRVNSQNKIQHILQ